jgi:photosystem II stability/assembly factor-like uncharacterized protein
LSTIDGGLTWSAIPGHVPSDAVFQHAPWESTFTDSGEGWFGAGPHSSPVVWRTLDGGASWQPIMVSSLSGSYTTSVRLLPGGGVLVLVSGEVGLQTAFISADQGASWQEVLSLPPIDPQDLYIAGAKHWWAFLPDGVLYTTTNAGQTWQGISEQGLPKLWNFETAGAIDADHAWRSLLSPEHSTESALAMTADGGAHWKMVNPPQPE